MTGPQQAREVVEQIEQNVCLPSEGGADRFAGYAVIGLPFCSGHVLALRRFPASSVGPGYTSVWHRNPAGSWTFYSTVPPQHGCSRYFSGGISNDVVTPVDLLWTGPNEFTVQIGERTLRWNMTLAETTASRVMNHLAGLMPASWWQGEQTLRAMGQAARVALGTGPMNLSGRTPNGQKFIANPRRVWLIESSSAAVNGIDIGPPGPLEEQARLNDFLIPQRGIFAVASAFLS